MAGFAVSNDAPADGSVKAPPMKWPKARPCASSHAIARSAASGAGPYSIVSKISATLLMPWDAGARPSSGR